MAHEKIKVGTVTGYIHDSRYKLINAPGNLLMQPYPDCLFMAVSEGYQLSLEILAEILPESQAKVRMLDFLKVLIEDPQCQELSLGPRIIMIKQNIPMMKLWWDPAPQNQCVIEDMIMFYLNPQWKNKWNKEFRHLAVIMNK